MDWWDDIENGKNCKCQKSPPNSKLPKENDNGTIVPFFSTVVVVTRQLQLWQWRWLEIRIAIIIEVKIINKIGDGGGNNGGGGNCGAIGGGS